MRALVIIAIIVLMFALAGCGAVVTPGQGDVHRNVTWDLQDKDKGKK